MFDLSGKVAVITGAAQGMGAAHARALAGQGATVVLTDVQKEGIEEVSSEIKESGGEATAYAMDVTKKEKIDEVFDAVVDKYGTVDILVNNAGIYEPAPFLEMSEEQWQKTIDINLTGQFLCAQRAAQEMRKNGWGRIINIASIASGQVGVGVLASAHYTASKGGVTGMTETLALELGAYGINVNAIGPGVIDTPMVSEAGMSEEEIGAMINRLPLKRVGKPEEVSAIVVFLASEEASYVTGATVFVDGGWLAT